MPTTGTREPFWWQLKPEVRCSKCSKRKPPSGKKGLWEGGMDCDRIWFCSAKCADAHWAAQQVDSYIEERSAKAGISDPFHNFRGLFAGDRR